MLRGPEKNKNSQLDLDSNIALFKHNDINAFIFTNVHGPLKSLKPPDLKLCKNLKQNQRYYERGYAESMTMTLVSFLLWNHQDDLGFSREFAQIERLERNTSSKPSSSTKHVSLQAAGRSTLHLMYHLGKYKPI